MWQQKEKQREIEEKAKSKDIDVNDQDDEEIDWEDFVIVQVIEFDDDDDKFVKPDIEQMGIEDVSTKIDEREQELQKELFQIDGIKTPSVVEPGMKIVENYERRRVEEKKDMTQICPRCHKNIPLSEWQEHLRIELLDPNWRKDKIDHMNREKNPMTAQGDQITKSLSKLIANRPDIAQTSADAQLAMLQAQNSTQENRVIWDGHSNTITRTTANSAMLAQQRARNIEEAMRVHSQGQFQPPATQGQFQLRPPNQTVLLGYQLPPKNQTQNKNQNNNNQQ